MEIECWSTKKYRQLLLNMTSRYYSYVDSIKSEESGNVEGAVLFKEVVDHLASLVRHLKIYNIGTEIAQTDVVLRREIESWISLPLPQFIRTSLVADTSKYTKTVDWNRLSIENATVANLGKLI